MITKNPKVSLVAVIVGIFLWPLPPFEALALDCSGECGKFVPGDWAPSLEQIRDDLHESLKNDLSAPQQVRNRLSQNLADVLDAELFVAYIRLMQTLDDKGRPALFGEQQRWLAERNDAAQAAVVSKGGSLAPLEYNETFGKITAERLAQLRRRLQKTQSTSNPNQ